MSNPGKEKRPREEWEAEKEGRKDETSRGSDNFRKLLCLFLVSSNQPAKSCPSLQHSALWAPGKCKRKTRSDSKRSQMSRKAHCFFTDLQGREKLDKLPVSMASLGGGVVLPSLINCSYCS